MRKVSIVGPLRGTWSPGFECVSTGGIVDLSVPVKGWFLLGLPVWAVLFASPAWAEDATAILVRVDEAAARSEDVTTTLDITVIDKQGGEVYRVLRVWQKGNDRRLMKFLEPARVAGVGLLVTDSDTIQLYLPAYGRTRRVAGSARGDAFMGTNFSIDDLTRLRFADEYTPELMEQDDSHYRLRLSPIKPEDHSHEHLEIWVRSFDAVFDRIDYIDGKGEAIRRIQLSDVRLEGEYSVAHRIEIEDLHTGRKTVATVRDLAFDTGLEEDMFTTRYLMQIETR